VDPSFFVAAQTDLARELLRCTEAKRRLWVVDVIAPLGGAENMVREFREKVYPGGQMRYVRVDAKGKTVAVV
jgi:hemolysin-activating ACP:hemolysin acyltransferase